MFESHFHGNPSYGATLMIHSFAHGTYPTSYAKIIKIRQKTINSFYRLLRVFDTCIRAFCTIAQFQVQITLNFDLCCASSTTTALDPLVRV